MMAELRKLARQLLAVFVNLATGARSFCCGKFNPAHPIFSNIIDATAELLAKYEPVGISSEQYDAKHIKAGKHVY